MLMFEDESPVRNKRRAIAFVSQVRTTSRKKSAQCVSDYRRARLIMRVVTTSHAYARALIVMSPSA
jgi:hypothetical protein